MEHIETYWRIHPRIYQDLKLLESDFSNTEDGRYSVKTRLNFENSVKLCNTLFCMGDFLPAYFRFPLRVLKSLFSKVALRVSATVEADAKLCFISCGGVIVVTICPSPVFFLTLFAGVRTAVI